jgi:hypothetical protein
MFVRTALVTFTTLLALPAAAYTIDGNLADWGINHATYAPASSIKGYTIDTDSTGGAGQFVNPGWGGQAYDAEALYVDFDATKLYLGLITGHDPKMNNNNGWAPGDFLIDFGRDGKFEYGLKTTGIDAGKLYRIGINDVRLGLFTSQTTPLGLTSPYSEGRNAVAITGGSYVGVGNLAIDTHGFTGYGAYTADKHYAYEAEIALNLFAPEYWGQTFDVQWTMQCGNDVISADPATAFVPEPVSFALMATALAALCLNRRRRTAD